MSGGNSCNDFPEKQLTRNIMVTERHRQVLERQLQAVERQTQVAEPVPSEFNH